MNKNVRGITKATQKRLLERKKQQEEAATTKKDGKKQSFEKKGEETYDSNGEDDQDVMRKFGKDEDNDFIALDELE